MYISASPAPESEAYSQVLMAGIHCVPDTVGNTVMKNSRIPMLRELTVLENRKTVHHNSLFLESTIEHDRFLCGENFVPE